MMTTLGIPEKHVVVILVVRCLSGWDMHAAVKFLG